MLPRRYHLGANGRGRASKTVWWRLAAIGAIAFEMERSRNRRAATMRGHWRLRWPLMTARRRNEACDAMKGLGHGSTDRDLPDRNLHGPGGGGRNNGGGTIDRHFRTASDGIGRLPRGARGADRVRRSAGRGCKPVPAWRWRVSRQRWQRRMAY